MAAIAQAHGLNANSRPPIAPRPCWYAGARGGDAGEELIALALSAAPQSEPELAAAPVRALQPDIRVDLHSGAASATVIWPPAGAAECGAWLREWLK